MGEGDGCYRNERHFDAPLGYALFVVFSHGFLLALSTNTHSLCGCACLQSPSDVRLYTPEANNLGQVNKVGFLSTFLPRAPANGWKKRWCINLFFSCDDSFLTYWAYRFILTDDYLFYFRTPFVHLSFACAACARSHPYRLGCCTEVLHSQKLRLGG